MPARDGEALRVPTAPSVPRFSALFNVFCNRLLLAHLFKLYPHVQVGWRDLIDAGGCLRQFAQFLGCCSARRLSQAVARFVKIDQTALPAGVAAFNWLACAVDIGNLLSPHVGLWSSWALSSFGIGLILPDLFQLFTPAFHQLKLKRTESRIAIW